MIKDCIKNILPHSIWYFLSDVVQSTYDKEYRKRWTKREKRVKLGNENPDKKFYVICRESQIEGQFSIFNSFLGHLLDAERRGRIPVVDMKNYTSRLWQAEGDWGKENAWEYFYEQPAGYHVEDIDHSKNVLIGHRMNARISPNCVDIYFHKSEINMWHDLYLKYIRLNSVVVERLNKYVEAFDIENRRILGVSVRMGINWGKQFTIHGNESGKFFSGYKEQPEVETLINEITTQLKVNKCDYLFMVVDDMETLEIVKQHFGEKMLYVERERILYFRDGKPLSTPEIPGVKEVGEKLYKFEREINYICEIHLLSKCTCFLGGRTSGNAAAFVINGNRYENVKIV